MAWLRTLLIWLGFLGSMLGGAALLLSRSGFAQGLGIGLLLLPVAVLVFLTLAHYVRQRRKARHPAEPTEAVAPPR